MVYMTEDFVRLHLPHAMMGAGSFSGSAAICWILLLVPTKDWVKKAA